jgi:hypothetical protein
VMGAFYGSVGEGTGLELRQLRFGFIADCRRSETRQVCEQSTQKERNKKKKERKSQAPRHYKFKQ